MPSTTNFGWTTPADTDLVKDGASAIRTLGNGIDTSFVDLKGGTTGQVLSKNSNTDLDFTWVAQDDSNAIQNAIVDAKGDLISATAADTPARLASSGVNGNVLTVDTSTATGLKWATPASGVTTWTGRYGSTSSNEIYRIAYNGSLYVAVGGDGANAHLITSSNGTTWTSRTSGFGANYIFAVVWDSTNSLWIIGGGNGTIATSPDGITWTTRTANFGTNDINDLATNAGTTVAVGGGGGATNTGGITYSTNGTTWTRKSQSLTVGTTYNSVLYNGTNWIVGASSSTNNYLYASDPSGTWTAGATGSNQTVTVVAWDGTRIFTVESSTANSPLRYSTSLTLGTTTQILNYYTGTTSAGGTTNPKNTISYYNGKIYECTSNSMVSASTTISNTQYLYNQDPKELTPFNRGSANTSPNAYAVFATGRIVYGLTAIYTSF